jgi:large subunit ribosomal protein L25
MPTEIFADLTGLDIGGSVHISDIPLPEGCTPTITDRDFTVATIAAPTIEVVVEEEEEDIEGLEGEEGVEGEEGAEAAEGAADADSGESEDKS